ncbi:unnamed protein product [Lactuca virosa]|uniref:Uncharacterized protein n=1 Tax=Lactuca virosa TaxID=75947 RepID=A0AAU9LPT5_9ASTR|nr:unnamed protein product [Lactuca virosa]
MLFRVFFSNGVDVVVFSPHKFGLNLEQIEEKKETMSYTRSRGVNRRGSNSWKSIGGTGRCRSLSFSILHVHFKFRGVIYSYGFSRSLIWYSSLEFLGSCPRSLSIHKP